MLENTGKLICLSLNTIGIIGTSSAEEMVKELGQRLNKYFICTFQSDMSCTNTERETPTISLKDKMINIHFTESTTDFVESTFKRILGIQRISLLCVFHCIMHYAKTLLSYCYHHNRRCFCSFA